MEKVSPLKVGVIGAGVAGLTAAFALSKRHSVTLIERNSYLGGHTNTIMVKDSAGAEIPVDTGFIVCNPENYPNFYRLLNKLGVKLRDSDMSFGFCCEKSGFAYVGPAFKEFIQLPQNLFNLNFIRMVLEQRRFNQRALKDLKSLEEVAETLGKYSERLGLSQFFIDHYLIPITAAIWSSPDQGMLDFPTETFLTFFKNHGMFELSKRPRWQTVVGGSHSYIKAFRREFDGIIKEQSPVKRIIRESDGVNLTYCDGSYQTFDRIVIACHADEALAMLGDPSDQESRLLGEWRYHTNKTVLHTDTTVLPKNRRCWASWNYFQRNDAKRDASVPISYYMNRLQGIKSKQDYIVTLNSTDGISEEKILYQTNYSHPAYTKKSVASQSQINAINGRNNTYYCGSYLGYGFHEDAVTSALSAARDLGGSL